MNILKIFSFIPLFAILLVIYLIMMLSGADLSISVFTATLVSGAQFSPTRGDLLIILGIVFLYAEIFKSTRTSTASVIEHGISMAVFLAFLIVFLTIKDAGTSTLLILTLMSLLDVVGGFTVTISTARRDWGGGSAHIQ